MINKNYISEAISSYYFEHQLPRVASQRNYQHFDKQNMRNVRNQMNQDHETKNAQCRQPLQDLKSNLPHVPNSIYYASPKVVLNKSNSIQKVVYSTKLIPYSQSIERQQIKEKRSESTTSQKKSVKFVEKAQDFTKKARENIKITANRPRSNSILKCRSQSKDSIKMNDTKSLRVHFGTDSRDYKNAATKQKYLQILNDSGSKDMKLRIFSSISHQSINSNHAYSRIQNKYVDPVFPPLNHSVSKTKCMPRIAWKRLSQFSPPGSIIKQKNRQNRLKLSCTDEQCYNFSIMLNLIKKSSKLLDFIFEDWKFNEKGAYLLKIFQQNDWKYIIIDDFIPIKVDLGKQAPAFLRIDDNYEQQTWPLLLQKAYASFLGSYQLLHQLSLSSLLSDLLRLPIERYEASEKGIHAFNNKIKQHDAQFIVYAQKRQKKGNKNIFTIIKVQKRNQHIEFLQENENGTFYPIKNIEFMRIYKEFTKVFIPNLSNFSSNEVSSSNNFGRQLKTKYYIRGVPGSKEFSHDQCASKMAMRSFNVAKMDQISIIVKYGISERKNSSEHWVRVLLFQKQLDSYRWIEGKYSNDIISISCKLEPGSYYLLLISDWSQESSHNFCMTVYGQKNIIDLHTESQNICANILQKGCSDLAQRRGKMTQINKWICIYSLVYIQAGIIIENINNERRNGNIRIFRTIKNLKTKNSFLVPLNQEFYNNALKLKNEAELMIEKQQSSSVVLLLFGGTDSQFLNSFNFGS